MTKILVRNGLICETLLLCATVANTKFMLIVVWRFGQAKLPCTKTDFEGHTSATHLLQVLVLPITSSQETRLSRHKAPAIDQGAPGAHRRGDEEGVDRSEDDDQEPSVGRFEEVVRTEICRSDHPSRRWAG